MNTPYLRPARVLAVAFASIVLGVSLHGQVIVNGGFESGLAGWTSIDQVGSDGGFMSQTGTMSPVNGFAVPAPPQGSFAAMTDSQGPGSHILFQDFVVPVAGSYTFGFSLFVNNQAPDYFAPGTLDFATPALNQRARIDLMTTSADPWSLAPGDVLQNLWETAPGSPLMSGYSNVQFDVTSLLQAYQGSTLRLRIAEVDNVAFLNLGVDNVVLQTQRVPDHLPLAMVVATLMGLGWVAAKRRRN